MKRTFQIYRYDPDKDAKPYMQTIEIELDGHERMLLDALPEERHPLVRGTDVAHLVVMAMDGYIMYRHTMPDRACSDATIDAFCTMLSGMPPG